jgi:threonine aldolase
MFGMDDALFFLRAVWQIKPRSRCIRNLVSKLICDKYAHVYNYEGGGVSFNSAPCKLLDGSRGMVTAALEWKKRSIRQILPQPVHEFSIV